MKLVLRSCAGLLLLVCLLRCGGSPEASRQDDVQTDRYKTFILSNEQAEQVLQIKWQNDTAISFVLEHRQAGGECNFTLSGEAVNPYLSYDPEADTDETGELYWIDQYFYSRGSCRLAIRVGQDTLRVQLQISSCLASPTCQLKSVGVLRREP
jgi:hypothetical protein